MKNTSLLISDIIRQVSASIPGSPRPVMITFELEQCKDADMRDTVLQDVETINNCSCSASCGSNYSRNGSCSCSASCGSNFSQNGSCTCSSTCGSNYSR